MYLIRFQDKTGFMVSGRLHYILLLVNIILLGDLYVIQNQKYVHISHVD